MKTLGCEYVVKFHDINAGPACTPRAFTAWKHVRRFIGAHVCPRHLAELERTTHAHLLGDAPTHDGGRVCVVWNGIITLTPMQYQALRAIWEGEEMRYGIAESACLVRAGLIFTTHLSKWGHQAPFHLTPKGHAIVEAWRLAKPEISTYVNGFTIDIPRDYDKITKTKRSKGDL